MSSNNFSSPVPECLSLEAVLELADLAPERSLNKSLFTLARGLSALCCDRGMQFSTDELREQFCLWFSLNAKYIEDVGPDDLFFDFLEKYDRVKVPLGYGVAETAWQNALASPYPPEAAQFREDEIKQLVAFCWQLQIAAGDGPFFLSSRKAQTLLGLKEHKQAARRLRGLVRTGVLEIVERGGAKTNRATRYRYVDQSR